jgi:hypothetical protein
MLNQKSDSSRVSAQPQLVIRLKNVLTQQRFIQQRLSNLAKSPTPDMAQCQELNQVLERSLCAIEQICTDQQASPANLAGPSRQTYAWMKFLTREDNLQLHLQAMHRAQTLAQKLRVAKQGRHSQGKAAEQVNIEFTNMAGLYKGKRDRHATNIQISEGFIVANDAVLSAVIQSALGGKSQQTSRQVRDFAISEAFSSVLMELDLIAEAIAEQAQGRCYNLDELFDTVNHEYFCGQMVRPRLTWNRISTCRKFAHYERARDRVVMSLTLDDDHVPRFVVEFVLYHELLHKQHGHKWVNDRLAVHTPEFRRDERKFKLYGEAEQWIHKLAFN